MSVLTACWGRACIRIGANKVRGSLPGGATIARFSEQITVLRHDDEFLAYVHRAEMLIKDVGVDQLVLDEALRHMMETLEPQVRALV